jgi:hypothetical protein
VVRSMDAQMVAIDIEAGNYSDFSASRSIRTKGISPA